jgi:hypothetical protein
MNRESREEKTAGLHDKLILDLHRALMSRYRDGSGHSCEACGLTSLTGERRHWPDCALMAVMKAFALEPRDSDFTPLGETQEERSRKPTR